MAYKGYTGQFKPKNPQKYVGNYKNIIFRSLKEYSIMKYFDEEPNVVEWSSEELVIPYIYEADNTLHRYYPDFKAKFLTKSGQIKDYLFEFKPESKMSMPKKKGKHFTQNVLEYIKNDSKWKAAQRYAELNNLIFLVIHEKNIKRMEIFKDIIKT